MEKVKRRRTRRHLVRNLPLKWSFMLYVLACVFLAIVLSLSAATFYSSLQSDLYYAYEAQYLRNFGLDSDALDDSLINEDVVLTLRSIANITMSPEDAQRYSLYGALSFLSVPIISLLCILAAGFIFYSRKLKTPLMRFDAASARIASGDLNFTIAYDNRNEMGRLATSFETMRAALEKNHREMWQMMEDRKQVNAAFAHDLRTPLTVLKGYCEYLEAYVPQQRIPEEKLLSTITLMHAYVTRLEGYTLSMSSMQQLEAIRPAPHAIAFDAVASRLRAAAEMLCGSHLLHFAASGGGEMSMDLNMVSQVLENLVSNASRYAANEIYVTVALDTAKTLALTISDDGPGFAYDVTQKGLVPYNRHKTAQDIDSEHFGLGLYICHILCTRHVGALTLPQEEGSSLVVATFASLEG